MEIEQKKAVEKAKDSSHNEIEEIFQGIDNKRHG
jgi:hypothetical protein